MPPPCRFFVKGTHTATDPTRPDPFCQSRAACHRRRPRGAPPGRARLHHDYSSQRCHRNLMTRPRTNVLVSNQRRRRKRKHWTPQPQPSGGCGGQQPPALRTILPQRRRPLRCRSWMNTCRIITMQQLLLPKVRQPRKCKHLRRQVQCQGRCRRRQAATIATHLLRPQRRPPWRCVRMLTFRTTTICLVPKTGRRATKGDHFIVRQVQPSGGCGGQQPPALRPTQVLHLPMPLLQV